MNAEIVKIRDNKALECANYESGDYINPDDGLLYCGKCHTPKQIKIEMFDRTITPVINCKCKQEELDRIEAIKREEKRQQKINAMRAEGFPESIMRYWTFGMDDKSNEKLTKVSKNYVQKFGYMKENGKGLLFYGNVGVGKSFYAACIANALIDVEIPCLMTTFSRLVNKLSATFDGKQEFIDSLNKYDLLVIDDLATERDTEYMNEIVYTIIDARYRSGLPTIITTNLTSQELQFAASISKQRVFSRVLEMTIPVEVTGQDRRKQKLANEFKQYSDILGL